MTKRICLDAGHYGKYNRSPVVPAYYESDMVWKLHLMLKEELERYGFEVGITRQNQAADLALVERGKASEGYDLFISLHSNAADDQNVDRVVCIYLVPDADTDHDEMSKPVAELLAKTVAEVMGTKDALKTYSRLASGDRDGDGKRDDNYYGVLHGADLVGTPAVILEHSFHTHKETAQWLLKEENLRALAVAEAKALADYYGMKVQEPQTQVLYRVQTGAYSKLENAVAGYEKVSAAGFEAIVVQLDGKYKVQVGAYSKRPNADAQAEKLKKAGFDTYITTKSGTQVAVRSNSYTATVKVNATLNVRSGPGTSYDRVGSLENGAKVTITQETDGWGKLQQGGWVHLDYIV